MIDEKEKRRRGEYQKSRVAEREKRRKSSYAEASEDERRSGEWAVLLSSLRGRMTKQSHRPDIYEIALTRSSFSQ